MSDRVGQQLGNYMLISHIGPGGFADVYLGEHVYLATQAAIKVLHIQLTNTTLQEFITEAKFIAALSHPNIVRVLDFGIEQFSATPFLIMEYAPNGTLRLNPDDTLTPNEVLIYVKQIAAALRYIHDHKLIHRDIKPENLLRGHQNQVLIGDFGIAVEDQYQSRLSVLGTPEYMAPEQIKGHPVAASDQYALAVIVYEWLCGKCPFEGTSQQIVFQHMTVEPPPFSTHNVTINPQIEQVIMKALAKNADERFPNVQEFADALEQAISPVSAGTISGTLPPFPSGPGQPQSAPKPPIISYTVVAKAGVGDCIKIYEGHRDFVRALTWSSDSQSIASGGDDHHVHVWQALTGHLAYIYKGHQNQIRTVVWSSNGTCIASGTATQVAQVWDVQTRATISTYNEHAPSTVGPYSLAWSPDDTQLASGSADGTIHIWTATTAQRQILYTGHKAEVSAVAWSPDGAFLASASDDKSVHIWNVKTKKHLVCTGHTRRVSSVAWSPDGKYIATGSDDRTTRIWESHNGAYKATYDHKKRVRTVAWSPDNTRIASAGDEKTIQVREFATGNLLFTCSGHEAGINSIAWSPDGLYLASGSSDGRARIWRAH